MSRPQISALRLLAPTAISTSRGLPDSVPGPERSLLFGPAANVLRWVKDPIGHSRELFERYGDVVTISREGGTRLLSPDVNCPGTVLVRGPKLTQEVCAQHNTYGKCPLSGGLDPGPSATERAQGLHGFGRGLFSVNGATHRRHRRLLMPAFSQARLKGYLKTMIEQTQAEISNWENGKERDIAADMRRLTLNIVSSTMFGQDALTAKESGLRTSWRVQEALGLLALPLTHMLPIDLWGLPYRRLLDVTQDVQREMRQIVKGRAESQLDHGDMLGALLDATDPENGARLSEAEVAGHVGVIFIAGHETSATALTWTLLLLAQHPNAAARVCHELKTQLGGASLTPEGLERLEYTTWVLKESMRLLPPVPWNGRVLMEAAKLGEHCLPIGTEVLTSIYETHRKALYPNPQRFIPERWQSLRPNAFEYNPFSAGARMCPGAGFAMLEMKTALALILSRYRLELVPQQIDRFAKMVLAPKDGLRAVVRPADGRYAASRAKLTGDLNEMVDL